MAKKAQNQIEENIRNLDDMDGSQKITEGFETQQLNEMLASVLTYLSDDEVEVIDIEYLLTNTTGLREWWEQYRRQNRKKLEVEISKSLGLLPLKELEEIQKQINQFQKKE